MYEPEFLWGDITKMSPKHDANDQLSVLICVIFWEQNKCGTCRNSAEVCVFRYQTAKCDFPMPWTFVDDNKPWLLTTI